MKNYSEFITEGKKGPTPAGNVITPTNAGAMKSTINTTDETSEALRRNLLDKFYTKLENDEDKDAVNKCVSTVVYCLSKNMRVDSDIIELLAKKTGKDKKDVVKTIEDETNSYYGGADNLYGRK
jgi:hypothetical protein